LIRAKGHEFGSTTGRPRRCGWFDAVLVRYAAIINGASDLAIMKLDVLDGLETLKIAVAYKHKGKIYKNFPHDLDVLSNSEMVYETVKGWKESTREARKYKDLPVNARRYVERLEKLVGVRVKYISVGSKRDEFIVR
jgi:adenylosuccinate synthase